MSQAWPVSRRQFLMAGAGLVVAAACGSGRDADVVVSPGSSSGREDELNLLLLSPLAVVGPDQRLALTLAGADAAPIKPEGPVQVSIDGTTVTTELHGDEVTRPYLLVRHGFDRPGIVTIRAQYQDRTAQARLEVMTPDKVTMPSPGQPMKPVPTPTTADGRGVNPICTRQPPCPLHDLSLDTALGERRPLAVLFATPARCETRFCGPVLDSLLAERDAFADRVRFVHVEIYTDLVGRIRTQPVQDYSLAFEPVLFLAGADGLVRERIDNLFDRAEARSALGRLVS